MAKVLTSADIVAQLSELGRDLDAAVRTLKDAEIVAVTKRHEADLAESRAFVSADGSVELRKHTARIASERQENEALVAEAVLRHLRAVIRAIDTRVEIGRSYNASVRAEIKMLPGTEDVPR